VGQEAFHIFSGGDAAQEDDFVEVKSSERHRRRHKRLDVARLGDIDWNRSKFPETGWIDGRIPWQQSARGSNHLRAGGQSGRPGEVTRIRQLSAKIKAAAKGEHFAKRCVPDLNAASEFESRFRSQEHPSSESSRVRGREKKHALHGSNDLRADATRATKPARFIMV